MSQETEIFEIFDDSLDPLYKLTNSSSNDYLEELTPIIKNSLVRDDNLEDLIGKLEEVSVEKSKNLETICKQSEDDILQSISKIGQIKKGSAKLLGEISEIEDSFRTNGELLIQEKKQYMGLKSKQNKINEIIEIIYFSLKLLELFNKVHELIQKEKFFIALKNLDDLKKIYTLNDSNVLNNFDFKYTKQVYQSIPILTNLIKAKSFDKLKKNLGSLEKNFASIGEISFQYIQRLSQKWYFEGKSEFKEFALNSPIELIVRLNINEKLNLLNNENLDIDLNPIYDCILIYESINELADLKISYNKELMLRKDKLFYVLNQGDSPTQVTTLDQIEEFLHKLSAFFIVDHLINRNTRYKLRDSVSTHNLWETIVDKLVNFLRNFLVKVKEDEALVQFKKIIGTFIKLMENFNFKVRQLYNDVLIFVFKKYQGILLDSFEQEFKISLNEDDSMPMKINDLSLYKKVLAVSWYQTDNTEVIPISPIESHDVPKKFPKLLPFSQLYPMTCAQIRSFVNKSLLFLEINFYNRNYKLLSQLLLNSLDELMNNKIGKHLKEKVNSTNREEIAQNLINLDFFYISSFEVSKLLTSSNIIQSNPTAFNVNLVKNLPQKNFRLDAIKTFKEIKKSAEEKLFEMVDSKVRALLELIEFEFESTTINNEPSMYIIELGEFLKAMFNSTFSNLPDQVLNLLIFRTFDILADHFQNELRNSYIITDISVLNFDFDLTYIEEILTELRKSNEVDRGAKKTIQLKGKFEQLRQIILLFKNCSFDDFKRFKNEKYDKIEYDLGVSLLHKLRINGKSIVDDNDDGNNSIGSPDMNGLKSPNAINFSRFYKFRTSSK